MTWRSKPSIEERLGDICVTTSGGTPSRSESAYFTGTIPWVKSGDLTDGVVRKQNVEENISFQGLKNSSAKLLPAGTVLIALYGATVGKLGILQMEAATNQAVCGIKVPDRLDAKFLFYFLLSQRQSLIRVSVGGAQPNISQSIIRSLRIPVPTLDEQRRIVDLLSRAENIVRMRREAEVKAEAIIPALFAEMFGDPANPARRGRDEASREALPVVRLGDLVSRFEGGKNVQAGAAGDSEYRILKISAVTSGKYDEIQAKPAPTGFHPPKHYFVQIGDLLFSRANTQALVGATALVETTDGKSLLPDKLWRFVWKNPAEIRPVYMQALLQTPGARKELSKIAFGTGGSMKNISQAKLAEMKLIIAPISEQKRFEHLAG